MSAKADPTKLREALGLNPTASDDEVRAAMTAQLGDRDVVLAQAVEDGKFRPHQLGDFAKLWDQDPDGTRNLVASLTPMSALTIAALGYANELEDDRRSDD